tara:strand:- start:77696 stop:81205 length:3510 start_codon:yes stop_codon:yes gene_type:complete
VLSLATAWWVLAPSDVSAQLSMPESSATGNYSTPAGSSTVAAPTPAAGQQLIKEARQAMADRDFVKAVDRYRKVSEMSSKVTQLRSDVARLQVDLRVAGIDSELLAMPNYAASPNAPSPMLQLPDVANASPIQASSSSDVTTRKREALRLLAIGRAALDRGDAQTALQIAKQAQALNVPEQNFAPGEPRVWQFVLDAESAARRSPTANSGVSQAGGISTSEDQAAIAQTLFNLSPSGAPLGGNGSDIKQVQAQEIIAEPLPPRPFRQQTLGAPAITQSPIAQETPINPPAPSGGTTSMGQYLYEQGLQALAAGQTADARSKFVEAWQYESQLDLATRRQLKDKLTLLQPTRLPSAGGTKPESEMTAIEKAQLASQEETRRLYREITTELADSNEIKTTKPLDALDQLNRLRRRVDGSTVDETSKRSLVAMVDRALSDQKQYVEANRAQIELDLQNEAIKTELATNSSREARIDEEISALVETYNDLMDERRFPEAEVIAKKVSELKPGSEIAISMFHSSRMGTRLQLAEEISAAKEDWNVRAFRDIEASAVGMNPDRTIEFDDAKTWNDKSLRRMMGESEDTHMSAAERDIQRRLDTKVEANYDQRPLAEVMEDLSAVTGIPIVLNNRAMSAVKVNADTPVTLKLPQSVSLDSALNLMLDDLELTYMIENDVLNITSIEAKQSNTFPRVYRVTDLVTPIPNFTSSYEDGLAGALRAAYQMSNPQSDVQLIPVSATDLGMGMANSMSPTQMPPNMLGQYNGMGQANSFGPGSQSNSGRGGSSFADFQSLIDLIQTTVVPDTWEALGGPSTMSEYPQNLSLVISTTSDVHDQISDLLESLRRLQNLQITIEVRFITLSDTFFEQIGVDFDVQFDDNVSQLPDDDSGPSVSIGFDGTNGVPTADLDIQFDQNNFNVASPFGTPDPGSFSTLGFAILSDIEAFFFLQAAQGDSRTNVMQAPKVTLFDGQIATISDVTQRPFVTSITPVVGDFAVAQQPVIVVLNEGTQLNVQGIVSNDRRFVRMTLVPFFSQIGDVDTFTFEGSRTTSRTSRNEEDTNGDGVVDENDAVDEDTEQDVITGTTVQLPTFAFTNVSTTVSVPDGGTILLGGIKRLAEGRQERGMPMLSKIPYLSRLFRNTAVGRDARSLMLMVTPRIIIQEEEELAQTGYEAPPR